MNLTRRDALAAAMLAYPFQALGNMVVTDLNAKVSTLDRQNPAAQAVAIRDGRFPQGRDGSGGSRSGSAGRASDRREEPATAVPSSEPRLRTLRSTGVTSGSPSWIALDATCTSSAG
jgi:hypothetical protein